MQADRLIAILMLLQKNGRTTAQELAAELEVSERTIYRDIDALNMAGVPVYAQRGPGGGIAVLDTFRTDLTGLNTAELQALMMLSVPAPLLELGIGVDLKSALRKVAAAAQLMGKEPESRLQDKFFIDSSEWARTSAYESLFEIVRKGLWGNAELAISYHSELGSHAGTLTAVIQPLGLVAAAGSWYLVAGMAKHITVIPLARIRSAQITAEHFKSPPDFILESFWQDWMIRFRSQRPLFIVEANVADAVQPLLVKYLEFIDDSKPGDGWTRVTLHFDTFETARTLILGWGNAVEVLAPQALRLSIADYARQILTVYE